MQNRSSGAWLGMGCGGILVFLLGAILINSVFHPKAHAPPPLIINGLNLDTRRQIFVELEAIDNEAHRASNLLSRDYDETPKSFLLRKIALEDRFTAEQEDLLEKRRSITHKATEDIWEEAAENHWGTKLEKR